MQKSHTSTKHCKILFTDEEKMLSTYELLSHAYYYYYFKGVFLEQ